ncbi:MAG: hypothetical protein ACKPJJ_07125, partial [Planctomycetaceae bacterium]
VGDGLIDFVCGESTIAIEIPPAEASGDDIGQFGGQRAGRGSAADNEECQEEQARKRGGKSSNAESPVRLERGEE